MSMLLAALAPAGSGRRGAVTLGLVLSVAAVTLVASVAAVLAGVRWQAQGRILAAAERLREARAGHVQARVAEELARAERVLANVVSGLAGGALPLEDGSRLEAALFQELTGDAALEEVTVTRGAVADGPDGQLEVGPERWQASVARDAVGRLVTRMLRPAPGGFQTWLRERPPGQGFLGSPLRLVGPGDDPTAAPTFSALVEPGNRGRALWSDLHFSPGDARSGPRRVVLSVQQALVDRAGRVQGVARVGLLTAALDELVQERVDEAAAEDPHRLFLLARSPDGPARLVARTGPADRFEEVGDDVRVVTDHPPGALTALLRSPLLATLDAEHPDAEGVLTVDGEPTLATVRTLAGATGGLRSWVLAIVVPRAHYTAELDALAATFGLGFLAVGLLALGIGLATLVAIRRDLGRVVDTTARMRAFDFAPSLARATLGDLDQVLQGLERAKTVVRAMAKYVPLDLVRRLYAANREPVLGGELALLTILFTDIEGFTGLSERLAPDELARRLGDYLEAMTRAIEGTGGTIDKYIGDAVMALWNAPQPVSGHAARACEAVLAGRRATAALFATEGWRGLPPLVTRHGLHQAQVLVGNFGAPTRLSYTALGDGVNLASRLESLCKQYGVTALASEALVAEAGDAFLFRRVDRVAVKGRREGVWVYELLGAAGEDPPGLAAARHYEVALQAYLGRDFGGAAQLLVAQLAVDGPSAVLHRRCLGYLAAPPPADWTGVHVASAK